MIEGLDEIVQALNHAYAMRGRSVSRRAARIRDLASEAEMELDEVLVTLWEAGIEYVDAPGDLVAARNIRVARSALGLGGHKEQFSVDYWLTQSGLTRTVLVARLADVGVIISANARKLPRNSLRRARICFPEVESDLNTRPSTPLAEVRIPRVKVAPLVWEMVGTVRAATCLTQVEVESIHDSLARDFAEALDPIEPAGVRDAGLLASAVFRPQTSLGEVRKYPTVEMSAAALVHSLTLNHAFHNGNKRTALVSLLAVLDQNDLVLTCDQAALFRFTLKVANHGIVVDYDGDLADREVLVIAKWIRSNSRKVERGERSMKWLRLNHRLRDFGCELEQVTGVGNRVNIHREVSAASFFGLRNRKIRLHTQVACAGHGTDADKSTIHKIRRDLRLDDEHNIDSTTFYAGAEIDSYIIDHRRILRRLAKL